MEGLLSYLTTEQIRQLFLDVAAVTGPQSMIAFNVVVVAESGISLDFGRLSGWAARWVQRAGEAWKMGLKPQGVPGGPKSAWKICGDGVQTYGRIHLAQVEKSD